MITAMDSRVLDANSEALGVSVEKLMQNAGSALASYVGSLSKKRVLFICGSGNNGGDGYAAYRLLRDRADVCAFREPKSQLCRVMADGVPTVRFGNIILDDYDVIVDCVLGTGPSGELRPEYVDYVRFVNSSGKKVVACDVPTGFGTQECVEPYATVTFHDEKEGMEDVPGIIQICDIGIPEDAWKYLGKGDFLRYPVPKRDSHKGQNGRLVIVGGGPYIGAPIMAALASLRAGTDLVTVMTPKASFIPIASYSPSYMVRCLSGKELCMKDVPGIVEACSRADALLIGPGLGTSDATAEAVGEILRRTDVPAVVDADGITCIAGHVPEGRALVFTPHEAELSRLIGRDASDDDIMGFCGKGHVVLRKGAVDRIYRDGCIRFNRTGSPGMTVGGTGDVLAGTAAGLLAKGMDGFDAACLAAYICGLAGERAFSDNSYGMTATDVIDRIGPVLKEGLE